jgi:hypothetical protein
MKASLLFSRLALGLTLAPVIAPAAEKAPSTDSITQEAAARAQAEATRAQNVAIKTQTETAARAARDAAAQARATAGEAKARVTEEQKARIEEANARFAEVRAKVEADRATLLARVATKLPTEPVTFLGVMTAPAPSSLTTQLGRPAGMGLVVVSVQAKSPAEDVLKVDDLLVRLDDQKLINNDQLTALIRGHQEGEEVTLTYVRGGKEATAKVKLVKQEVAAGKPSIVALTKLTGLPNEEMKVALGETKDWKIGSSIQGTTTVENGALNQTFTYTNGGAGITEIKTVDGKKTVTLRNSSGGIEFTGPYDTEEQRKAAPASVQTRVADAESRINAVLQVKAPAKAATAARAAPVAPKAQPAPPAEVR